MIYVFIIYVLAGAWIALIMYMALSATHSYMNIKQTFAHFVLFPLLYPLFYIKGKWYEGVMKFLA